VKKKKIRRRNGGILERIKRRGAGSGYHSPKKYSRKVKHKREFE